MNVCGMTVCARSSDLISCFYSGQKYIHACVLCTQEKHVVHVYVQRIAPESERSAADRSAGERNRRYFRPLFFRAHRRIQPTRKKKVPPCTIDYNPRITQRDVTYCNQQNKIFDFFVRRAGSRMSRNSATLVVFDMCR